MSTWAQTAFGTDSAKDRKVKTTRAGKKSSILQELSRFLIEAHIFILLLLLLLLLFRVSFGALHGSGKRLYIWNTESIKSMRGKYCSPLSVKLVFSKTWSDSCTEDRSNVTRSCHLHVKSEKRYATLKSSPFLPFWEDYMTAHWQEHMWTCVNDGVSVTDGTISKEKTWT